MKRLVLAAVLLLAATVLPRAAAAQCNQKCLVVTNEAGEIQGYGCAIQDGSGKSCISTAYRCNQQTCSNALLTDSEGAAVGVLRRCAEAHTLTAAHPAGPDGSRAARSPGARPSALGVAKAEDEAGYARAGA